MRLLKSDYGLEIGLACPDPDEVDYDYITELRDLIATLTNDNFEN